MEALRFFAVSLSGVIVDLAISLFAAKVLDLPLWISAMVGFATAATLNYTAHELWTFRGGERQLSSLRGAQYIMSSTVVLGSRLIVVAWLGNLTEKDNALFILICGAGVSFVVNFFISKYLVFSNTSGTKDHPS